MYPAGQQVTLRMAPRTENAGHLDRRSPVRGWFNPLLAPSEQTRIALVIDDHIIGWAEREDRPDIGQRFARAEMTWSGFTAAIEVADRRRLRAIAVIDDRIGVELPSR